MLRPYLIKPTESKRLPRYCTLCENVATMDALFQMRNYLILRRYCTGCINKAEYEDTLKDREPELTTKQEEVALVVSP
jgi:hypothetical protein